MRIANLLDRNATLLPILTEAELNGICLGGYQPGLASGYVTDYQFLHTVEAQGPGGGGGYVDPATLHHSSSQMPQNIPCYIWEQRVRPAGWNNAGFGPWERFAIA